MFDPKAGRKIGKSPPAKSTATATETATVIPPPPPPGLTPATESPQTPLELTKALANTSTGDMPRFEAPEDARADLVDGANSTKRFNLGILTLPEKMRLYDDLMKTLPPTELSKMNLEKELLLQFHSVRELQNSIMDSQEGVPMNQRAQVANSVSSLLKSLIDLQESVHTTERFKKMEGMMIRMLVKMPEAQAKKFLKEYEQMLEES